MKGSTALRRLRRALAPALHVDPDDGRPWWWSPDRRRLVAFRVVVVDQNALDGLAAVATAEHPALSCLLAALVGVDEPDAGALAVVGRAFVGSEVVLDGPTHDAHYRVASRLLRGLREVHERGVRAGDDT